MKLNTAINEYLDYIELERKLSINTKATYTYGLSLYQQYLLQKNIKNIDDIKVSDINNYIIYLKKRNKLTSTIAHQLSIIKSFHKFLFLRKYINVDISITIDRPKLKKKLPVFLTIEQVDKLLDIKPVSKFDYRNKAMLELLYGAGLRISELINVKINDLNVENATIICFGKGKKERIIPIGEYIIESINDYLNIRDQFLINGYSDYLFLNNHGLKLSRQGFNKILNKILINKNLPTKISPHSIRHSFATHMLDYGADLKVIQDLLGHSDIATTKIYTQISKNKTFKDYDIYHPRSHK
ncbi:MAG: tyrosine recombinase [Tenericutes bacterium]|nr:tyrosine recombinase [Mycoplasmatota bacterium]